MKNESKEQKKGAFDRFLDGVEWLGNLLPHPGDLIRAYFPQECCSFRG